MAWMGGIGWSGFAVVLAAVSGCSSNVPPPSDQWAAANEQIGRATATAPAVPDAKLHLQLAQEDLQKSKALIGRDNRRATTLITLATTEAQLASALASASQSQDAAMRMRSQLQGAPPVGASNLQAPNPAPAAPATPGGPAPAPTGR
jgi:hypothetical protein